MGAYLLARDGAAVSALMPRIADMSGPAYVGPDGRRRTPRYYQEAMAIFGDMTGKTVNIEGFEIQPETIERMNAFKRIMAQSPGREAARQAAWDGFRDTYFFYALFGAGDYR
jgi:ABC-type sugar transport system substrate-binding protein